jgi:hypothetical protein
MEESTRMREAILPLATAWAGEQEALILSKGSPLGHRSLEDALCLGVEHPDRIRLLLVETIPLPDSPVLVEAAQKTGLLSDETAGLTLRYGIFIRMDCRNSRRLIAHECVHVAQYERLGGIQPFLRQYLGECLTVGYRLSPLEMEAVAGSAGVIG